MGLARFRYRECLEEACVLCVVRLVCLAPSALLNEGLHILFHVWLDKQGFNLLISSCNATMSSDSTRMQANRIACLASS